MSHLGPPCVQQQSRFEVISSRHSSGAFVCVPYVFAEEGISHKPAQEVVQFFLLQEVVLLWVYLLKADVPIWEPSCSF